MRRSQEAFCFYIWIETKAKSEREKNRVDDIGLELGLWYLTSLSTIFRGGQFYWWMKPDYPE